MSYVLTGFACRILLSRIAEISSYSIVSISRRSVSIKLACMLFLKKSVNFVWSTLKNLFKSLRVYWRGSSLYFPVPSQFEHGLIRHPGVFLRTGSPRAFKRPAPSHFVHLRTVWSGTREHSCFIISRINPGFRLIPASLCVAVYWVGFSMSCLCLKIDTSFEAFCDSVLLSVGC